MEQPRLEVGVYQIVDDAIMKANRTDGTGFEWGWADWRRDWMDATPVRHAYRCLPLTIVNQTGWWVRNPVGFTATWGGGMEPGAIDFRFDTAGDLWKEFVNSHFGEGIITWTTPFLFRTKPEGSRLLICGPANSFKANAHPLTALIESDWMSMSFTMNWKVMTPGEPVRFEAGEPIFQAIPLARNVCADLEGASVTYQKVADDPEVSRSYLEWNQKRREFHAQKAKGEVKPDGWQRNYFQGLDGAGREAAPDHMTKVKPPKVIYPNDPARRSEGGHLSATLAATTKPVNQSRTGPRSDARRANPNAAATRLKGEDAPVATTTRSQSDAQPNGTSASNPAPAPSPRFDDEWRRWVAENLLLGPTPADLVGVLTRNGFTAEEATREVELAAQSPYLRGADRLRNRLRKREWLLATYRKLNRLHPASDFVERRHRLSRGEFLEGYYSTNRPVIITGMMDDWPAVRKWGYDFFKNNFGDQEVEVSLGRNADQGYTYEAERHKFHRRIRFGDFVEKVWTGGVTNEYYLTANNDTANKQALAGLWDDIVQVPEYLDVRDRKAGFFWLGPPGTITPFHHDLTNNFMAQVIGRKRLKLVPSWDVSMMRNDFHVYSSVDGRVTPPTFRPGMDEPQVIECILNAGEILFLPIGCFHFVEGLDISVTITMTNFIFGNDFASTYTTHHNV